MTHTLEAIATTARHPQSAHRPKVRADWEQHEARVAAKRHLYEVMKREAKAEMRRWCSR